MQLSCKNIGYILLLLFNLVIIYLWRSLDYIFRNFKWQWCYEVIFCGFLQNEFNCYWCKLVETMLKSYFDNKLKSQ
jgi:hypothetical protein